MSDEPYDVWNPTRREHRRNRVILNPCEVCKVEGKLRSAKVPLKSPSGEMLDVCMSHYLKATLEIRESDD